MGRILAGVFLILLSLFMLLGFLQADLPVGALARIVFFIILVLAPALGGGALLRSWFARRQNVRERKEGLRKQTLVVEILKLAGANGGTLRVIDVVAELGIPQAEAEAVLEQLAVRRSAEVDISESGVLVYRFDESQIPTSMRSASDAKER